jgi:hypothetical protein
VRSRGAWTWYSTCFVVGKGDVRAGVRALLIRTIYNVFLNFYDQSFLIQDKIFCKSLDQLLYSL